MPFWTGASAALVLFLFTFLYLCWQMLQPFVDVLLWALVLVMVFLPVHRRVLKRARNRATGAAISTLLVVVTLLVPAALLTYAVVRELTDLAAAIGSGGTTLASAQALLDRLQERLPFVDLQRLESRDFLLERLQSWTGTFANRTLGMVSGVMSAVIEVFLVIFTMFYVFRDGDKIRLAIFDLLPLELNQSSAVYARMLEVISASVYGVLVIAGVQGALGGFIFWVLGLPSPLLWGLVMFFLSTIPMAGSFLVWAPAALLLAVSGHWPKGLFLTVWGVLVVGSIDNFLSPRLVGHRAKLRELLIFFGVLGGLDLFGVIGIVLGLVIVAITLALIDAVRQISRQPSIEGGGLAS